MTNAKRGSTILAIDPGTRLIGIAVLRGQRLVFRGVTTLPPNAPPSERLENARRAVLELIQRFRPDIAAVETAFFAQDRNAALLNVLIDEIRALAREQGIRVRGLAPSTVRKRLCGDGRATKSDVAQAVAARYPVLKVYLTKRSDWEERYYGNMFDAVAVGLVAARRSCA